MHMAIVGGKPPVARPGEGVVLPVPDVAYENVP